MFRHARPIVFALLAALSGDLAGCRRAPSTTLRVAIGADMEPAFRVLAGSFSRSESTGINFDSDRIEAHAARLTAAANIADVLVSTDPSYVGRLVSTGRCDDLSRSFFGFGSLVVVTSASVRRIDNVQEIADPQYARVAVPNPERDAFGRAAIQALNSLGISATVVPRISRTETAREALALVRSGAAQAAIVPRMIVVDGDSLSVSADLHQPVEQVGVMCAREPGRRSAALRFLQFAREGGGKRVLESYGFVFP